MIVKILKSNRSLGIKKGEMYKAIPSFACPDEKLILEERIPDGYQPYCSQYREFLQIILERIK